MKKFKVCYITAELAPLAKAGGLADVSAALTQLLHRNGHEVRCFLPLYADLVRDGLAVQPIPGLTDLTLEFGPHRFGYSIRRGDRGSSLPALWLVESPALFDRPGLYGPGDDEHLRFLMLSRAALEACVRTGFAPDILHCHDWHTALAPLYLKTVYRGEPTFERTRSVLTIHNLGYQGVLPAERAPDLGLGDGVGELDAEELAAGRINFLRQGLVDADLVSTVSPTYAREITTPEQGMGLDGVLRARGDEVVGILNGVDCEAWDPSTDAYLPHRYSRNDLSGKTKMRAALCARLGLDGSLDRPLIGMVTRLAWQKGIDLLFDVLPGLLSQDRLALAVLGSGDPAFEEFFSALARAHPGRAAFRQTLDEELAHWIEAGSDAFLMPSRYEPCGLNQLYSLRYGTLPFVRRTGGLADSVTPFDPASGTGTGIVFNDADSNAVRWALQRTSELYGEPASWRQAMINGMSLDLGWEDRFPRYLELYAAALERPRG